MSKHRAAVEYDFNNPRGRFRWKKSHSWQFELHDEVILYHHPEDDRDEGFGVVVEVVGIQDPYDKDYYRISTNYAEVRKQ